MISPIPSVTATKPGSAMRALPGIGLAIVDEQGTELGDGHGGFLVAHATMARDAAWDLGRRTKGLSTRIGSKWPQYYFRRRRRKI